MIVIDTCVWIWLMSNPKEIAAQARRELAKSDVLGVCAISCWEVVTKAEKGRLDLVSPSEQWILDALRPDRIKALPLDAKTAVTAAQLKPFHGDPCDRIIVATAIQLQVPLATRDHKIRDSGLCSILVC